MKKIIALLLTAVTVLSSVCTLTGCKGEKVHIYTRSEWIGAIAEIYNMNNPSTTTPYFEDVKADDDNFNAIQACVEWDIIEKDKKFNPDKRADVDFAIVTAVKSIGIDRIAKSVNGKQLSTDKEIIDYFNENSETKYISGSSLYMDTASEILSDVSRIYGSLVFEQSQDISYTSNVVTVDDKNVQFSMDGETATLHGITAKVGDIITLEPSELYPFGMYAKVTEVNGSEIKYTEPEFEEMFESLKFSGTYEPEFLGFVPASDGIVLESVGGASTTTQSAYFNKNGKMSSTTMYVSSLGTRNCGVEATPIDTVKQSDLTYSINENLGKVGKITGSLTISDISVTSDVDISVFGGVKKANIELNTKTTASVNIGGQDGKEMAMATKTFKIGEASYKLFGVVGFSLSISMNIGAGGKVTVTCSFNNKTGFDYQKDTGARFIKETTDYSFDIDVKAKVYAKPSLSAAFVVAFWDVANIGVIGGVEATAETTDKDCVDINVYLALGVFAGGYGDETLLGKLGAKLSEDIWTVENSPLKKNIHVEDWQVVPECTRGSKETDEEALEGAPGAEELENMIINSKTGLIISTYFAAMEEKQTDKLLIEKLPDGYTASDLVFTSSNPSVATVDSNGVVSAISQGVCYIDVETKDGEYSQRCTVTVLASYYVDFTPLGYTVSQPAYIMV